MKERIQKVLSDSGIASRRQIEKFIQEKRIFVGDRLAKLGEKISKDDQIFLDGKKITLNVNNKLKILALNKPETPVESCETILFFLSIILERSNESSLIFMP